MLVPITIRQIPTAVQYRQLQYRYWCILQSCSTGTGAQCKVQLPMLIPRTNTIPQNRYLQYQQLHVVPVVVCGTTTLPVPEVLVPMLVPNTRRQIPTAVQYRQLLVHAVPVWRVVPIQVPVPKVQVPMPIPRTHTIPQNRKKQWKNSKFMRSTEGGKQLAVQNCTPTGLNTQTIKNQYESCTRLQYRYHNGNQHICTRQYWYLYYLVPIQSLPRRSLHPILWVSPICDIAVYPVIVAAVILFAICEAFHVIEGGTVLSLQASNAGKYLPVLP